MNTKLPLFILACFVFVVLQLEVGSAIQCNYTGTNLINSSSITDGCTLDSPAIYNMSGETFNLNGSLTGAINITTLSITLDCKGSTIIGNNTNFTVGIYNGDYNLVNIHNCNLINYSKGISLRSSQSNRVINTTIDGSNLSISLITGSTGFFLYNSTIRNSLHNGIFLSNSNGFNISNNTFNNSLYPDFDTPFFNTNTGFVYGDSAAGNGVVQHNVFSNAKSNYVRLAGNNNTVSYNDFIGQTNSSNFDFDTVESYRLYYADFGSNSTISFNNFSNSQYSIMIYDDAYGLNITNNYFHDLDIGIRIGGNNTYVANNDFQNITLGVDTYTLGIKSVNAYGFIIENNTINKVNTGIWIQGGGNGIVRNNVITELTDSEKVSLNTTDFYDFVSAIRISSTFKSWKTEGNEFAPPANNSVLEVYRSNNFTILNNTLNNYDLLYYGERTSNVVHDLSCGKSYALQFPLWLYDREDYCIKTGFNNLSYYNFQNYSEIFERGYRGRFYINYKISQDSLYFLNQNSSAFYGGLSQNISLFNQTNALLFNTNGSVYGSTNTSQNDGNINITLQAGNSSYVLDNFNLTEGVTRQNSPLAFITSTILRKEITSTLTNTINATVVFNVSSCDAVDNVVYTSHTGTYRKTYRPADYTCSSNQITLYLENIEPALSSNELQIDYDADGQIIQPLNLRDLFLVNLGETPAIFTFIAFIIISVMAARFRMPNFIYMGSLVLFTVIMSLYIDRGIYILAILGAGLLSFYATTKMWKQ